MQTTIAHTDYQTLYEQSQTEIAFLKHELAKLKQLIYGSKHERFVQASHLTKNEKACI